MPANAVPILRPCQQHVDRRRHYQSTGIFVPPAPALNVSINRGVSVVVVPLSLVLRLANANSSH